MVQSGGLNHRVLRLCRRMTNRSGLSPCENCNLYHIPNVVCRLYDPEREVVYREFGIDTICPTVLSTREIDRLLGREREATVR